MKKNIHRIFAVASLTLSCLVSKSNVVYAQSAPQVLRIVPQVNLTVLDPIFSSAYVTRNHGYMIYDTLFGVDDKGNIKPQMVDRWTASPDHKTWTFTLRPGLAFHDGAPVTSDDVIASLKRWSTRDALGGLLAQSLDRYEAVDANTFRIHLKEPFGLVLEALGKQSSPVPGAHSSNTGH
jgi:peptide/nickel transport system substrate-binding protein